ncbi:MAG: radical SAM protein [Lachnospiraceae bacterium]|nr:radical SAM protein [Lachnospiraceae bacterium]
MTECTLCPRNCHINRNLNNGYCKQYSSITAARAALHMWEEPCISGSNGSGAVFFSGCNMGCVFCQNYEIAHGDVQKEISSEKLADIFLKLQNEDNAHNINLVTPTHFIPQIVNALEAAKNIGLTIPIVYNTSGYENVTSLKLLDGLVDIYLPDCKYYSDTLSLKYSNAPDYFDKCSKALDEMYRQVGNPSFEDDLGNIFDSSSYNDHIESIDETYDDDYSGPLMKKGMIIRHLILPGNLEDSKNVIGYLLKHFSSSVYISIMNQYTPMPHSQKFPELTRKISSSEYNEIIDFALDNGIENGFFQGDDTATDSFIPAFDFKGLD